MRLPTVWLPSCSTFVRPMRRLSAKPKCRNRFFIQLASLARISTPAWIFSQIRGTAKNSVGWTSRRLAVTVSIDSAKLRTAPDATDVHVEKMRSATWHSGRYVTM